MPHFNPRDQIRSLLMGLNDAQADAVTTLSGVLLILAGAGSGKTRCIAARIGMLLEHGIPPRSILAVTFTNKAAREMKERVAKTSPHYKPPTVATFHAFAVRLLRRFMPLADPSRTKEFTIYDKDDSEKLTRQAIKDLGFDTKFWKPGDLRNAISGAKNQGQRPSHPALFPWLKIDTLRAEAIAIYRKYEDLLRTNNAVDFDDLLLLTVHLLRTNDPVREMLHERFKHVMVDEFQDTNGVQYELLTLLTCNGQRPRTLPPSFWNERSLCVVGDDQQSVYGFRKADVGILRSFEQQFGARRVELTINYRSTEPILQLSNAVIGQAKEGFKKTLTSYKGPGKQVIIKSFGRAEEEARWVAQSAAEAMKDPTTSFAVLYRTTAQARLFEEAMRQLGIRYTLTGGLSFYERAEIKDVLAYIQFALNPNDTQNLLRIINTPKRGLGEASLTQLQLAASPGSLYALLSNHEAPPAIKPATWLKAQTIFTTLTSIRQYFQQQPLSQAILSTLAQIQYFKYLETAYADDWESRVENVQELVSAAVGFDENENGLSEFIDHASLNTNKEEASDDTIRCHLMTMHGAKGLEFPHVTVAGVEQDFLPHYNSKTMAEFEEERRLLYVGLTRAETQLYVTYANYRVVNGQFLTRTVSPFMAPFVPK